MAMDSTDMFAFNDPFEEIPLLFPENPTLGLQTLQNPPNNPDIEMDHDLNDILDPADPLSDPVIWAFCNETDDCVTGNPGAEPSGFAEEGSIYGNFNPPQSSVSGDHSMPLTVFSVPQTRYNCICCQRLREITHSNGMNAKRLEIHGRFGVISHAVLVKYDLHSSFQSPEFQMFDFQKESMLTVKKFLVHYFEARKQEGYCTLQDPLSSFYQALCVGLNEPHSSNDFLHSSPENTGDCSNNQQETLRQQSGGSNQGEFMKIPLATQRERTRNLKIRDLMDYFNLPIDDAARKLNICPTVMKKICRRNGMLRWPYRKIKSLEGKISKKVKIVDSSNDEERAQLLKDIQKHQQELANIYGAFTE